MISMSKMDPIFNSEDAILLAAMCYQANQLFETGKVVLPKGFKLRYTIYALAGVEDPKAEPFGFITESANEIVIAYRGTESFRDNESNQDLYQVPYPFVENVGKTHRGFTFIYQSTRDEFIREIMKLSANKRLFITGYSLGGGLAVLAAFDISVNTGFKNPCVYTYGSPRVADPEFASQFYKKVKNSIRIFNVHDIIPTLPDRAYPPPFTAEGLYYRHVNKKYPLSFQLNSLARNHYMDCYFNKLSKKNPDFSTSLSTGFCPNSHICLPFEGTCSEKD